MVDEGLSIVFITHKLKEVSSVCHRISVLREGHNILTVDRDESSADTLVKAMVGEDLDVKESVLFSQGDIGIEALEVGERPVANLDGVHVINKEGIALIGNVSFQVHEKEIFGIAGVAGNGQRELAESIMGLQPIAQGSISIDGMPVNETTTAELLESGVAYIPEDRLQDGFLPKANVAQNMILGFQRQEPYSRRGFIDWKTVFEASRRLISEYNVKTLGPAEIAGNLSGGNIQRVMVARAFSRPCRFLVAHNPTRGLDISSMDFVYSRLLEWKEQGMATLLLSEDLDELLLLCDRLWGFLIEARSRNPR
jgi:simple sugar transport system ATP-binding protein